MATKSYKCKAKNSVNIFEDTYYTHGVKEGYIYVVGDDKEIEGERDPENYELFPNIKAQDGAMILVLNKFDYNNYKTFRESPEFEENFEWIEDIPDPEHDDEPVEEETPDE